MALAPVWFLVVAGHTCVGLFPRLGWGNEGSGVFRVGIHVLVWVVGLVRCLGCSGGCWGVHWCLVSSLSF